jgi:GMP synthase-like glutamine amidotransferase
MKILSCIHSSDDGLGYFESLFYNRGIAVDCHKLYRDSEKWDLKDYQGLILMGGAMNVDQAEEFPFLKISEEYIAAGLRLKLPMMGFCLGGQLLAKGLGAEVKRNPEPELGWYGLELGESQPSGIFKGFPKRCHVFQWHQETFGIPPGAVWLAGSHACKNQAFAWEDRVFGFQFHLEMTGEMVSDWVRDETEIQSLGFDPDIVRRDTAMYLKQSNKLAEILFENFLQVISCKINSKG